MAQQNIDFGTFPDDPNADAIRTAFRKVQENFTEVYSGLEAQGVSSVNRTPGAGISVSSPVGNVIVTANIACVQVHTSTLSIGRDANGLQDTSITSSSQILYVDLPASITGVTNITVSGYLSAVGNVIGGNINAGAGIISTTGNANVGNLNVTGNATVAGNISTGNISISGSFSITGNANVGNLGTTGLITATGNITGGNIVTPNVVSATGNITGGNISTAGNLGVTHTATVGNLTVTGNLQAGDIGVNSISYGNSLIDISNPGGNITMHVNGVPDIIVVTDTGMNLAGYLNATGNANVANLGTAGLITATGSISGGTLTTVGDANVGNLFTTGLISATGNITGGNLVTSGVLSVTGNANVGNLGTANITATGNVGFSGANVNLGSVGNLHISGGTAATVLTTDGAGNLSFTSFSGSPPGGPNGAVQYNSSTAYAGEAGFEYNDTTNTLSVDNISLIGTGNLTSGNLVSANYLTGTLTTGAQPNITSVGTLSSLSVSGNANIGNIGTAGLITATGNIDGGNINSPGRLSVTGNVIAGAVTYINNDGVGGQVLTTYGNGVTYWSAGTGGTSTSIVNGTSNVNIGTTNGNVTAGVGGTADILVLTPTGANVNGTLSVSGNANVGNLKSDGILSATGNAQAGNFVTNGLLTVSGNANIGNIGTSGLLTVAGNANVGNIGTAQLLASANVTAPQLISNIATGSPPLIVLSTTQVANLNVANAGHASTANTVVDNAQPNITSVGILTSLSVSGNANIGNIGTAGLITATGNITGGNLVTSGVANVGSLSVSGTSNLGPIGNVTITGGSSGQYLQTNGSGVLSWETVALSIISNGNSNVSIPAANGNVLISAIGNANIVVVTGTGANINGTLNVSGNANIGNIGTAGLITATGNITGGNLITAGIITAIGNANVGNLGTAQVLATANVTAPQLISNVSTGTAPLVVTSTTRVANLNVDHANVSDFSNVTTQTTGTFYPTFVNANTTANYALGSNANLSFNAATGNLSATILHATGGIEGGSFSTTGNITGANLISTKYIINSVQTGISAAGTTQGAATALGNTINIVSTVTNGANGVVLPTAIAGMTIYITNTSANALNVFPAANASINTGAANASISQAAGATLHYIASNATQWYTVGATYA